MKRIVSLSVFGDNPRYLEGARRQYELAKYWYPGWEFRLYIDDASRVDLPGANVIEVKSQTNGMFWRFYPLFEDAVVLVRDADSRITAREAMAVYEWLASGRRFHLMRDHAWHRTSINAGMLGVLGPLSAELALSMMVASIGGCEYGRDEDWLEANVYPLGDAMLHTLDSGWFKESRKNMANPYEFVGNGFDENDWPIYEYEPKELRRDALPESSRFGSYRQVGGP